MLAVLKGQTLHVVLFDIRQPFPVFDAAILPIPTTHSPSLRIYTYRGYSDYQLVLHSAGDATSFYPSIRRLA